MAGKDESTLKHSGGPATVRFWIPRAGSFELWIDGFLSDPEKESRGRTSARPLADLQDVHALGLLGEPGIGKSTALVEEHRRLSSLGASSKIVSVHVDLREFSSDGLLVKDLFERPEVLAWTTGDTKLFLHLDSLDEALLRVDAVANLIGRKLRELPRERLFVRIACRTAVWPELTLEQALKENWDADACIFELAPLRRIDAQAIVEAEGIDTKKFLEDISIANLQPFALKPLTLKFLIGIYKIEGRLPSNMADLYRLGCTKLCEEANPSRRDASRRDARYLGRLNPAQRLCVAGRLATMTMLGNRYAVWTGAGMDTPKGDIALSEVAGGTERVDSSEFSVDEVSVREVLDTGLFSARGPSRMGWAHQSYAEFLAARYLVTNGTSAKNIIRVLTHPSGGMIPQLSIVAAWAATLNREVRRGFIETDPIAMLQGDLNLWDTHALSALTQSLLDAHESGRVPGPQYGMHRAYARLAHSGLSETLRTALNDESNSPRTRGVACDIAKACAAVDLCGDLLRIALDEAEHPYLRGQAIAALSACGDETAWRALVPLVTGHSGPDPYDDVKGEALQIVWPKYVSALELFSNLPLPCPGHIGTYVMFLTQEFPDALAIADLPIALRWAAGLGPRRLSHSFHLDQLRDKILVRAWDHFEHPGLSSVLLDDILTRVREQGTVFHDADHNAHEEFFAKVAGDRRRRHAFLQDACQRRLGVVDTNSLCRANILLPSDFEWLLAIAPGGTEHIGTLDEETLCNMVRSVVNPYDSANFELLFEAAQRWRRLWDQHKLWFEGVPLNSVEAEEAREHERFRVEMRRSERSERPALDPPPAQRVQDCLLRFESGELEAWWQLNRVLTLKPDSTRYGFDQNYFIVKMPGWLASDGATRTRIVRAASVFLRDATPEIEKWIGTNEYYLSDLAAYRALLLLRSERIELYDLLDASSWRRWTPVVVAIDRETGSDEAKIHDVICADASAHAPEAFANTVKRLIRIQRAANASGPQSITFPVLYKIEKCLTNPFLRESVYVELLDEANTFEQHAALLQPLLEVGDVRAREHALALVADERLDRRPHAVRAAAILLGVCARVVWAKIWPAIELRPGFGAEVFLWFARHWRSLGHFDDELDEEARGALYIWLARTFTYASDPKTAMGSGHYLGPRDMVRELRDGVLRRLVEQGSVAAVVALHRAMAELPELDWLKFEAARAEEAMRRHTWQPLRADEIRRLTTSKKGLLIRGEEDLCEALVDALQRYEGELRGAQTPVRALWDKQRGGEWIPVDENAFSDHVIEFLRRELVDGGIALNREVEIGRVPGAPVGDRTDIKVDAIRSLPDCRGYDQFTSVIEAKGCWNRELFSAMESQLRDNYLQRLGASLGIYLVAWFDSESWDDNDRARRAKGTAVPFEELRARLEAQAVAASKGCTIKAVVLDCRLK